MKTLTGSLTPWTPQAKHGEPLYSLPEFIEATQGTKLTETQRFIAESVERITARFDDLLDRAAIAALASGVPQSELWLERRQDGIDTRLMRHVDGAPQVGGQSRGEVVARVWMEPLDLGMAAGGRMEIRYEGIDIGPMPGGA